jgi:hypothetical protein
MVSSGILHRIGLIGWVLRGIGLVVRGAIRRDSCSGSVRGAGSGEAGEPGIVASDGPLRPTPGAPVDVRGCIVLDAAGSPVGGEMG